MNKLFFYIKIRFVVNNLILLNKLNKCELVILF